MSPGKVCLPAPSYLCTVADSLSKVRSLQKILRFPLQITRKKQEKSIFLRIKIVQCRECPCNGAAGSRGFTMLAGPIPKYYESRRRFKLQQAQLTRIREIIFRIPYSDSPLSDMGSSAPLIIALPARGGLEQSDDPVVSWRRLDSTPSSTLSPLATVTACSASRSIVSS